MTLPIITRFAPSPTGYLHVGNSRMALINWLFARHHGGEFMLRIDDTDAERSKPEYTQGIIDDLTWLGLDWSELFHQAQRHAIYDTAIAHLKATHRLYPCFETPDELAFKRKRQMAKGQPPRYDRAALDLSAQQIQAHLDAGLQPHWRFLLQDGAIQWDDLLHGPLTFQATNLSDPIVIRSGGQPVFTLVGMVDDLDKNVTHVLRGDDHISNTAVQIQIMEALAPLYTGTQSQPHTIRFGHFPLLIDKDGGELSKRLGSQSVRDYRAEALDPMALCSFLATMGTSNPIHFVPNLDTLVAHFDITHFSSSSPRFDTDELLKLNTQALQNMSIDALNACLRAHGQAELSAATWDLLRPNVASLADITLWMNILAGRFTPQMPPETPQDYAHTALSLLPTGPWEDTQSLWKAWMEALKSATGLKGRALIMPLRQRLTGQDHGPDMPTLLAFLGPDAVTQRLDNTPQN